MKNAVMAMLEENAQRFPDKIALADEFRQMSYREYLTAAVLVARAITPQLCAQAALRAGVPADGVDPQAVRCNPVGVLIDRNVLSVASFMGIAYTGNFYVPLDPELPPDGSWFPLVVGVMCVVGHMLTPYMKFMGLERSGS